MNVNELLDTIEDALEEGANVPLSGGKKIVDVEQIRDYLDEVRAALPGELRIYRTDIPATDRRVTLMQDALYRSYVAHRSMGYPQAPVPSYYLGDN